MSEAMQFYIQAQTALERGEFAGAIAFLSAAIHHDPDDVRFRAERALAYRLIGDLDKSIADYTEAMRIDPAAAQGAYQFRGELFLEKRQFARALNDFREAEKLGILSPFTLVNRGVAHDELGRHEQAIADFTTALQEAPELAWAYQGRGVAHLKMGNHQDAIADFTTYLRHEPEDPLGYAHRAQAYLAAGSLREAEEDDLRARQLRG